MSDKKKNTESNEELNNIKNEDKFSILTQKINSLSNNKTQKNFKNFMESKIKEVEENFKTNIDSLDQKYAILNEQFENFSKMLEEEKILKEEKRIKNEEELNEFEQDIKNVIADEREYLKAYVDDCVKKIEDLLISHSQEVREENNTIKENVENLKNYIENEINNANNKINEENEDKINDIKNLVDDMNQKFGEIQETIENKRKKREEIEEGYKNDINEIMEKVKEEFSRQKKKREEFEENVFTLIEDTCTKLATYNS